MFAFVLMPFSNEFDDVYRLGIKSCARKLKIDAMRVDEQFYQEGMLERIYNQITAADIVIADMSGRNPNVFYEVGYAHAKKKPTILITRDIADIPFDLKHHRHIIYNSSISTLRKELTHDLRGLLSFLKTKDKRIDVEMNTDTARLIRRHYEAEAHISLVLDFYNRTPEDSSLIDNAYFYTGDSWVYSVDGIECPRVKSDASNYDTRHLIQRSPRRLERNSGWFQIRLNGAKTVARALHGERLLESYPIVGKAMLRLVSEGRVLDYEFVIEATASEFPI